MWLEEKKKMQSTTSEMDITSAAYHDLMDRKLLEPRTYWHPVHGYVTEPNGGWQTIRENTRRGRRREKFRKELAKRKLNDNKSKLW